MSFEPLLEALRENPDLVGELLSGKTPRERHAILDAHGIEKPTLDSELPDRQVRVEWGQVCRPNSWGLA
jgi:hypothetical protein